MSQLSFSSFDASLMVRDAQGHYLLATADQILEAARQAIEQKMQRGASFSSPAAVKEYLRAKLAGFEHEVFAVLFLDTQHRLIEYAEMFRGTIDSASVYPRELVKEALRLNAAAVIVSHNHPSGNPEPSGADKALTSAAQAGAGAGGCSHAGSHHRGGQHHHIFRRTRLDLIEGASAPFLLRPMAQLRPSRACACCALAKGRRGCVALGAVLLCPFTVSRRSRRQGRRVPARLRPVAVSDP
jgi:DNA repair protein RadC